MSKLFHKHRAISYSQQPHGRVCTAGDTFCLLLIGTPRPTVLCPVRLNEVWAELEVRTQAIVPFVLLFDRGKNTDSPLPLL